MERKRLRVDGIPTDIPAERAKDKLTIHFLRSRNGGGEVEKINIIQGNPAYAIVTFEDDEVVDRVLRIKDHFLQVKDKRYALVVNEFIRKVELEEVFQKLSLTVSYKKFPESCRNLLKNLMQAHTDVKFDFDKESMTCVISGPYAVIQTMAQEILSKLEIGYTNLKQISSDTRRKTKSDLKNYSDLQDNTQVLHQRSVPVYSSELEARYSDPTESLEQLQEPFVWDSDIFKYIQKFQTSEYQGILNKYHVHAVDESGDGITTIYLQSVKGGKNHLADLSSARFRLMGLYQGLELLLRKEQIDKRDVNRDQEFHKLLLRDLQRLYPMLLCHDDEQYLYLIGNGVDVAQGKQYISDVQLKFDRPSSYRDIQFKASGSATMSEVRSHSVSPTYKHESKVGESKVGNRIAASFNIPTTHSSYAPKSQIDEKYLVSSNSYSRQLLDREKVSTIDKTSIRSAITSDFNKTEDLSLLQPNDKSESKTMPMFKKLDVLPVLKTGREDIRQSRATSKHTGPLKPVRITKASSELPYSSLVDMNSPLVDFKIPEGKLRRSNSLSRVYSKENTSSEQQNDPLIFKDEVIVTHWLWHYINQNYGSDIKSWCSEVVLMEEEKQYGNVSLKLKATNKASLILTKERLQLLCWKEDVRITSSCLDYVTLGVQGPDDSALTQWCELFQKCSKKLSIKLQKDNLVLVYPKEVQASVLNVYSQHIEPKTKSPSDDTMTDDGQSPLPLKDKFEFSDINMAEEYIAEFKQNSKDDVFGKKHLGGKDNNCPTGGLTDQKYPQVSGTETFPEFTNENKTYFNSQVPSTLDEDFTYHKNFKTLFEERKSNLTSEKHQTEDFYTPRKQFENVTTEVKTFDHGSYTSEVVTEEIDFSPSNVQNQTDYGDQGISTDDYLSQNQSSTAQLRSPAVGQESEIMSSTICVQCKNSSAPIQTSGQNICIKCFTASIMSTLNDKAALGASMVYTTMSLRLPGYEQWTSFKIIYEVPDGIQRAGDPQPGCAYKGGKFEAYLPDNPEGKKLLVLLQKALDKGLIFQIKTFETEGKVMWHKIPHKTSPDGGKQKNGYPDLTYMKTTVAILKENGIE
ncbi:uncharacterized protein LOC142311490 isoform X1 [Anomaloglossus baeobatrachus]|uniref:uncharacterized protein LOC142311490 isoform X1 n=2 Tax=Anomaloglossus baeobatrachus TaxID=238106 RepID=UPI003F4F6CB6